MKAATTVAVENRSTPPWMEMTRCHTTCRQSAENPVTANSGVITRRSTCEPFGRYAPTNFA